MYYLEKWSKFLCVLFGFLAMIMLFCQADVAFAEQTGAPFCGRSNPSKYKPVDYGGGTIYEMTLLDGNIMETNIAYIKRGILPARTGIGEHRHENVEEMYMVFNAPAEFTVDGSTSLLPAGSCVLCPLGSTHALYNNSDETIEFVTIGVSVEKGRSDGDIEYTSVPGMTSMGGRKRSLQSPAKFRWARFDRSLTKFVGPAHLGAGLILNRRPWGVGSFETNWGVIGHCILPPGSSIGYHRHDGMEEVYYIMDGHGRSTVNDHTWDVGPGDAIPCTLHDSHGLYNNTGKDLDIFVLSATLKKNKTDATNHGDDLSKR